MSIHPAADAEYPHDPLEDGDELAVGNVTLRCRPHAGPPAGALLPRRDRHDARRRAVARPHRRLAVRRRRRPTRPRGRRDRRAPRACSTRSGGCSSSPTASRCSRATSPARSAATSMSSRGSTTIGFERRFNPMVAIAELDAFVAESARRLGPEAAEPRPHRRAQPRRRSSARSRTPTELRRAARRLAAPRRPPRRRTTSPVTGPGAINVPVVGTSFSTKAGFVLDADDAGHRPRRDGRTRQSARSRGLRSVAFARDRGLRPRRRRRDDGARVTLDELEAHDRRRRDVIDVREKDERDEGYIPGSRHVPVPADAPLLPGPPGRPAGRDDLRLGPARRDRREHPRARRASTPGPWSRAGWTTGSRAARRRSASAAAALTQPRGRPARAAERSHRALRAGLARSPSEPRARFRRSHAAPRADGPRPRAAARPRRRGSPQRRSKRRVFDRERSLEEAGAGTLVEASEDARSPDPLEAQRREQHPVARP